MNHDISIQSNTSVIPTEKIIQTPKRKFTCLGCFLSCTSILVILIVGIFFIGPVIWSVQTHQDYFTSLKRWECESQIGVTLDIDYYIPNRDICYAHKANNGDISACYFSGADFDKGSCIGSISKSTQTYLCYLAPSNSIKNQCIDYLLSFVFYNEVPAWRDIDKLARIDEYHLKEGDKLPLFTDINNYSPKVEGGVLTYHDIIFQNGSYTNTGSAHEFTCRDTEGFKLSTKDENKTRFYLDSCTKEKDGVYVKIYQIKDPSFQLE